MLPGRKRQIEGLLVVRRNVAGMDLGGDRHWMCAPTADGAAREIADFGARHDVGVDPQAAQAFERRYQQIRMTALKAKAKETRL